MMDAQTPSDAADLSQEFGSLIGSTKPIPSQVKTLAKTLSLSICGGPTLPTEQELPERVDRLWGLLNHYIEGELEAEFARNDPIGEATPAVCVEAARILFRCEEDKRKRKSGRWYCIDSRSLGKLQKAADEKVRGRPEDKGDKKYFRQHLQYPILEALARLLLRDEAIYRRDQGLQSQPARRLLARRTLLVGVGTSAAILLALLAFAIVSVGGSGGTQTLAPRDLTVSLAASLEDGPGDAGSPGSTVDLGKAGGAQELGFQAVVRPVSSKDGRIPPGLRLVVVVPRKSLANESLPSAFLRAAGSSVREVGQQSSDAVTISSPVADRLGLDVPSDFRIQVKRDGSAAWGAPQLLSDKWLTCSERSCVLSLPLARFTGDTGEAVRVGFQTLAFDLSEKGPTLVMDMKQRRLGDRFARDGELHVSPGDRVLYSLYLANQGTKAAHNVRARLSLPSTARLIPGSVRAATTGAATPFAVADNLANGGVTYAKFGAGASARYTAIAEVSPRPWAASFWLVKSDETHGTEYYDSAKTSTEH